MFFQSNPVKFLASQFSNPELAESLLEKFNVWKERMAQGARALGESETGPAVAVAALGNFCTEVFGDVIEDIRGISKNQSSFHSYWAQRMQKVDERITTVGENGRKLHDEWMRRTNDLQIRVGKLEQQAVVVPLKPTKSQQRRITAQNQARKAAAKVAKRGKKAVKK